MDQPTDVHQADVPQPIETVRIPTYEPWSHCVGSGWQRELVDPFLTMIRHSPNGVFISQIKEKFGGLRLYIDGPEWVRQICGALEHLSYYMCEDCGCLDGFTYGTGSPHCMRDENGKWLAKKVTRENKGWIRTLCAECRQAGIEHEKAELAAYRARHPLIKKESE